MFVPEANRRSNGFGLRWVATHRKPGGRDREALAL
jgi:hypothetical protein